MTGFHQDGNLRPLLSHAAALYHSYLRRFAGKINEIPKESAIFSKVKHEVMLEIDTKSGRDVPTRPGVVRMHHSNEAFFAGRVGTAPG
jgi:hypothetical protein